MPPIKEPVQPALTIQYFTRQRYGRTDRFFVSSQLAFAFKGLTSRTVILDRDMEHLTAMGFRFEEVEQPV